MKKPHLFQAITKNTTILFCAFAFFFITANYALSYKSYQKEIKEIRIKHVKSVKNTLKWEVEHFIELIKTNKINFENNKKNMLKKRINQIHFIINSVYEKYKDTLSEEEIKDFIITVLRKVRFPNNGYYFITSTDGTEILFDPRKELEGTNMLKLQNSDGVFVVKEMIQFVKNKKEGFYTYKWTKPKKTEETQKISYIKLFEPYGWIIGNGIYKDDLDVQIQERILNNIEQMKFDKKNNNYIFIATWDGISLTYPAKGKNMYRVQDKNGLYIVQELIKKAKTGGGFVQYVMPSFKDERNTLKMSYVQGMPEWKWYVGAGLYIDDINDEIAFAEKKLYDNLLSTLITTIVLAILVLLIFSYFYKNLNKMITKDFSVFIDFFNSLVYDSKKINIKKLKFSEFEDMAIYANAMLSEKFKLEKELEKYQKIVSTSKDFLSLVDKNYVYQAINNTYLEYFQKSKSDVIGHSIKELFGKEFFDEKIKPLSDRALKGEIFSLGHWVEFPRGKRFLETSYFPYYKNSEVEYFVISAKDNTEKKLAEEKVKLWKKVFENTSEAVMICDIDSNIVDVNYAFTTITGYSAEEIKGRQSSIITYEVIGLGDLGAVCNKVKKIGSWNGEVKNKRKNGNIYPALMSANIVLNEHNEVLNLVAVFSDITILKESERKLEFLAHHDALTKLPNRVLLKDRITHAIENSKRNASMLAICFIDLDNFKKVNDSYGHTYGDDILKQSAIRIKNELRAIDTLSRIGGDEFILLLENLNNISEVESIMNKIQKSFESEFISNTQKFSLSASTGISLYPQDGNNSDELIKNADIAMYKSKEAGRNTYTFFTDAMSVATHKMLDMENDLRLAIQEEQFIAFYQPQINLKTKEVVGFEALIRWDHPKKGLLQPMQFIKYAEENKMIIPIGEYILRKSCEDLITLQNEIDFDGRVSINVSGIQIQNGDFLHILKQTIQDTRVNPNKLELEITESVIMEDPQQWIELLNAIKDLGVKIAIDDFGTGYSSLSYLRKLPIDKLKIDMSFVNDIPDEEDACAIANSVINLSENMKMITLAEGIETKEQENYLRDNNCEEGQGYLYAKPMDIDKVKQWLKER